MFAPQVIQGRWLGAEDLEALQRLIAEHPHWSRRRLSIALCEALNWRTASGQLKDMSARLLLNKLAERGFVKLPPRRPGGGRQILRALSEPELFSLSAGGGELIEGPLRALQPLEVIPVEPRTTQANAFVWHLGQHHYLGYGGAAGQNLRYLIRDCFGQAESAGRHFSEAVLKMCALRPDLLVFPFVETLLARCAARSGTNGRVIFGRQIRPRGDH